MINKILEEAVKKAQGAQVSMSQAESVPVSYQNDKLKSIKSTQNISIGLRVIFEGKVGRASASLISDGSEKNDVGEDIISFVNRAIEAAEFGPEAHYEFPKPQPVHDVKIYDERVPKITKDELVNIAGEMLSLVKGYSDEILVDSRASISNELWRFANSSGVEFSSEGTYFSVSVGGQRTRGTDILFAGHGLGRRCRDIDHTQIAKKAIEKFRLAEKNVKIASKAMPVIFPPEAINILLLAGTLGINGKNVLKGDSPLAGKLGQKICDERITITDNPLIDYASGSGSYDGEGVPHQVTPIIEKGVLLNFLYDLETAGRAGTKSTGHGPGCGTTNIIVEPGNVPYKDMIKNISEGLIVEDVMGLGQGNIINGEFSVNVQLGYKIENGEIIGRVKDVMLAGNSYDALNNVAAISKEAEWVSGSLFAPAIQIESLSVVCAQKE